MAREERGRLARFRCADCAYGVSARKRPRRCPRCGARRWQQEDWQPLERLHVDLRPNRAPALSPAPEEAPAQSQPARPAFRALNEEIRWLQLREADEQLDLVCECDDQRCFAPLSISLADHERLRVELDKFLVLPGHETEALDEVLEAGAHCLVVRARRQEQAEANRLTRLGGRVEER
jgi:hypothetical protein